MPSTLLSPNIFLLLTQPDVVLVVKTGYCRLHGLITILRPIYVCQNIQAHVGCSRHIRKPGAATF